MTDYRETHAHDYLDPTVKDTEAIKKGDTAQRRFLPRHIIPIEDQEVQISDSVTFNANRLEIPESVNVDDDVELIGGSSGGFEVLEGADELALNIRYGDQTAVDESGNGFHGTLSGAKFASSGDPILLEGLSLEGDGNGSYHEIPHNAKLNGGANGAHAVEFWIILRTTPAANRMIFVKGSGATGSRAPAVWVATNRRINYAKSITSSSQQTLQASAGSELTLGALTHVVCQFSTSIGMEIWINAVRVAQAAANTTAMFTNSTNLRIGRATSSITTSPDAIIIRPKFYTRTLSQTEIQNLKNNRMSIVEQPAIVDFSDVG